MNNIAIAFWVENHKALWFDLFMRNEIESLDNITFAFVKWIRRKQLHMLSHLHRQCPCLYLAKSSTHHGFRLWIQLIRLPVCSRLPLVSLPSLIIKTVFAINNYSHQSPSWSSITIKSETSQSRSLIILAE